MDDITIARSVELDASVEDVWTALTDPGLASDWLDGQLDLDIRPGSRGTLVAPDGPARVVEVEEATEARRLTLRWWPQDGSGPASVVRFDLEDALESTRLTVTETLLGGSGAPTASTASASGDRWALRLVLLGCCLLRTSLVCR